MTRRRASWMMPGAVARPGALGCCGTLLIVLSFLGAPVAADAQLARSGRSPASAASLADGPPRHLLLALDGIPRDLFVQAQARGRFATFHAPARLVAPFPSLTDVSFSAIAGSGPPEGFQVMRYDANRGKTVGRSIGSLSGRHHRHLPTDSRTWTSAHRMRAYMLPRRAALAELRSIRRQFLESNVETFVAYVEATDPMLHVHGAPAAERFLVDLEEFLDELQAEVRARTGGELAVTLISDHGSTLVRGKRVKVRKALREAGFRRARRLRGPGDVAYSQAGIIGFLDLHCWSGEEESLARAMSRLEGIDAVAWRSQGVVHFSTPGGEGELSAGDGGSEGLRLRVIRGDPFELGSILGYAPEGARPVDVLLDPSDHVTETLDSQWPHALPRLWRAFNGAVQEPGSVLVSMQDGYESGNRFVRSLAALRGRSGTHGSLTRMASVGVLMANWRSLPDTDAWGARELLFSEAADRELSVFLASTQAAPPPEGRAVAAGH